MGSTRLVPSSTSHYQGWQNHSIFLAAPMKATSVLLLIVNSLLSLKHFD